MKTVYELYSIIYSNYSERNPTEAPDGKFLWISPTLTGCMS